MPQISQKRSASITIDLTPEQQEEYKEIAAGRAALNKREDDLRKAIRALPEVKIAANLAGTGLGASGQTHVDFHAQSNSCTVRFEIDERVDISDEQRAKLRVPNTAVFIDPKTLNLLLSGKLITDKEKRDLVRTVYPALGAAIVDELVEGNQAGGAAPIEAGERWVFRPDDAELRELVRITRVDEPEKEGSPRIIWTVPVATAKSPEIGFPMDEEDFRARCVKVEGEIT